MHIERLKLKNFRCFNAWEQDFTSGFNVFIGDNGSGKTAVLDALAIGVSAFIAGFREHKFRRIEDSDIRLTPSGTEDDLTLEPNHPVLITTRGKVNGQSIEWRRSLRQDSKVRRTGKSAELRNLVAEMELGLTEDTILPLIAYYPTGRLWKAKLSPGTVKVVFGAKESPIPNEVEKPTTITQNSRLSGYLTSLNATTDEGEVRNWLRRLEESALQRKTENVTLEAVKSAVAQCLERWTGFYYDINLRDLVVKDVAGRIMLARLLSHGQRSILFMVADLAYRCARLNPKLRGAAVRETPGVVLIDELELHLHPNWQRRIISDLRRIFPKIQFFVTTHSPTILQNLNARYDRVYRMNATESGVVETIIEPTEEYINQPHEDILSDVMDVPNPALSHQRQEMIKAAENYYSLLKLATKVDDLELESLKQKMDELALPYNDNPAYIAFLNMERRATLGDKA